MKILVAYDGSVDAKAGLVYGIKKARATGGELIAYHILKLAIPRDDEDGHHAAENTLRRSLQSRRTVQTYMHRNGNKIRTTIVFAVITTWDDILKDARAIGADLIISPPKFEPLMAKACCLVDIVTSRRGYFGEYNRPEGMHTSIEHWADEGGKGPGCGRA